MESNDQADGEFSGFDSFQDVNSVNDDNTKNLTFEKSNEESNDQADSEFSGFDSFQNVNSLNDDNTKNSNLTFEKSNKESFVGYSFNNENSEWNADFDRAFGAEEETLSKNLKRPLDESVSVALINDCFPLEHYEECVKEETNIEKHIKDSLLFEEMYMKSHDPVKFKETYFYEWKLENIFSSLNLSQVDDARPSYNQQFAINSNYFNFHNLAGANRLKGGLTKNTTNNSSESNGYYKNECARRTPISEIEIKKEKFEEEKLNGTTSENDLMKVNGHVECNKKALEEYSEVFKSNTAEEILVHKANIESKIEYLSTELLNELEIREKAKRDLEIRNDFIASYIRVEGKLKDSKRKKNKYGLFRNQEDDSKNFNISIPYLNKDHGPSTSDLLSITKILKAIENDDAQVSKLISDYVLNLGEDQDLPTVIQIRTKDGVVSLGSPSR